SIYLDPLPEPVMQELLDGLVPGMPESLSTQILERAEGVPLYAVETVRMLLDSGLVEQDGSTYRVVAEVDALEVPETLHALIAAVVASHLLAAFEAVPAADDAEELKGRARDALVRAGDRASGLAAAAEAQRYFEQAGELTDDERARAELEARAGDMAWRANKIGESRALLDRAHGAYEELGDPVAAARVASRLADCDFIDGHPPQAVTRLEPALAALEAAGTPPDIAAVAAQLGRYLVFSGDEERALPYLERALTLAEVLDQPETLAEALNSKGLTLANHRHRMREGTVLLEGALAIALEN